MNRNDIEKLLDSLTLDEMIGQMLCFAVSDKFSDSETEEIVKRTHAGSFFVSGVPSERIRWADGLLNKYGRIPGMIAADVENGPGHAVPGEVILPNPMAWGACCDSELIEKAHEATAGRCRKLGIHWSFSPIVDINFNKYNPIVNIRAISDMPEKVAEIGAAAVRGMQKNGLMAAGCKHFPGDGMDDRNQHFCTTVNSLSKERWMETYGYVYKEMFKAGAASVMAAHIALPAYDEKLNDWLGYPPASISYNLQTRLLRQTLGYKGCIVSDAMSMIGAAAAVPYDRLSVEFVKAGGDILLFPLPEYFDQIKEAVKTGEILEERIRDAAGHALELKAKARLFEDQNEVLKGINSSLDILELAEKIGEKAVTKIRDFDGLLPLKLNRGDKILIINIKKDNESSAFFINELDTVGTELKKRGFETVSYVNPSRSDFEKDMETSAAVLINCRISSQDYVGGTLRIMPRHIAAFWRGAVLRHPNLVFASFGDPYKLYDYPYLKTYINVYSYSEASQRGFVKALLGEIPFLGRSPVSLEDFF